MLIITNNNNEDDNEKQKHVINNNSVVLINEICTKDNKAECIEKFWNNTNTNDRRKVDWGIKTVYK